jgi:acyl-CoA reductase-like NAD-dependent aldehyde dehydrogenase
MQIKNLIQNQRDFFAAGHTLPLSFRLSQLRKFKRIIIDNEDKISAAVFSDLCKPDLELYGSDIANILNEIDLAIGKLKKWVKPKRAGMPLLLFPSSGRIVPEPYGTCLVLAPWNYPFNLAMVPVIGAIAAGNTAIIKPSEKSSHTSRIINEIISSHFDPAYLAVVEGGVETVNRLLAHRFDFIFYTGSTQVGRIIMKAASRHPTPVVLALGGKCPCIADKDIDIRIAARRIAWGKFFNAGQSCVSPDYLLVNKAVKTELIEALKQTIHAFYGPDPRQSPHFARIINQQHTARLSAFLSQGEIICGGEADIEAKYIAPTLIDKVSWDHEIMKEEIFGPILPILEFNTIEEAIHAVNARPKPLTLYFFSNNEKMQVRIAKHTSSGYLSINDTVIHFIVTALPLSGVGESGMGAYHGLENFNAFTHFKSIMKKPLKWDTRFRYPPHKKLTRTFKKLIRILG